MRRQSAGSICCFRLALVLPYMALACFGQFLHSHASRDESGGAVLAVWQPLPGAERHPGLPPGELQAAPDHDDHCAACAWTSGTQSHPIAHATYALVAPHVAPAEALALVVHPTPSHTPPSVRAPPQV